MTKIQIKELVNFDPSDKERAEQIVPMMEYAINSEEFKKRILEAEFKDTRFRTSEGERAIDSNEEIYRILKAGKERHSDEAEDGEWDLRLKLYRSLSMDTVGKSGGGWISTKKRKFRKFSLTSLASHWIHEYCHVLGFHHDFKDTDLRPFSVPYLVDDIAEDILEESGKFD